MTDRNEYKPDHISPPGDTIADLLEERGWSINEFCKRLRCPLSYAQGLLKGQTAITGEMAVRLEIIFETTAEFWIRREMQYRDALRKKEEENNGH